METEVNIDTELSEAQNLLKLGLKLGADEIEIFLLKSGGTSFSIEKNAVGFASSGLDFGLGFRVIKDKKIGFSYCSKLELAEPAIKQALTISKLGKVTNLSFPSTTKDKVPSIGKIYDPKIPALTPEDGLEKVSELIDSAKEVDRTINVAGGGVGFGEDRIAVLNSNGLEIQDKGTGIFGGVSTVLNPSDSEVATGFEVIESRCFDFDYTQIGRIGAELAVNSQRPQKIESQDLDVVFTPFAFVNLLEYTVIPALYGEPARKGESVYSDKIGEQVTIPDLSWYDDGALENGLNSAVVDDEGVPSRQVELVKDGILQKYLYDLGSATEFETESTGNGQRAERLGSSTSYKVPPSTKCRNFVMKAKNHMSYDALISEVQEGILVYDVMGAHTANPASGDIAVNSTILFKIDKGEISYPCKQVMISGNVPELMKNIVSLGDDFRYISGGLTSVAVKLPSVRIRNIRINS
jgi:PmbA protein